jgi:hypothetical protein
MEPLRNDPPVVEVVHHDTVLRDDTGLRPVAFQPTRRRWPGVLAAAVIGAGVAAIAVSSHYDPRSVGQRLDASIGDAKATVAAQTATLKSEAKALGERSAAATDSVAERTGTAVSDAGITAAVKAALAADPALSAIKINVTTADGVVTLAGPAPDDKSRDRAAVLAAAPEGVRSVDNRLVVSPGAAPRG